MSFSGSNATNADEPSACVAHPASSRPRRDERSLAAKSLERMGSCLVFAMPVMMPMMFAWFPVSAEGAKSGAADE